MERWRQSKVDISQYAISVVIFIGYGYGFHLPIYRPNSKVVLAESITTASIENRYALSDGSGL